MVVDAGGAPVVSGAAVVPVEPEVAVEDDCGAAPDDDDVVGSVDAVASVEVVLDRLGAVDPSERSRVRSSSPPLHAAVTSVAARPMWISSRLTRAAG